MAIFSLIVIVWTADLLVMSIGLFMRCKKDQGILLAIAVSFLFIAIASTILGVISVIIKQ